MGATKPAPHWARELPAGHSSQQVPATAHSAEADSQEKTVLSESRFVSFSAAEYASSNIPVHSPGGPKNSPQANEPACFHRDSKTQLGT